MQREDVRSWALERGFEEQADGRLVSAFLGVDVEIVFLRHGARLQYRHGDVVERRLTVPSLSRLSVNEHGVIEGMGLGVSILPLVDDGEAPVPPWFTDGFVEALGLRRAPERSLS